MILRSPFACRALLVSLALAVAAPTLASASPDGGVAAKRVIPPGHEAQISGWIGGALTASGIKAADASIAVDGPLIKVTLPGTTPPGGRILVVGAAGEPATLPAGATLADGVVLTCAPACSDADADQLRPLATALATARPADLWQRPKDPPRPVPPYLAGKPDAAAAANGKGPAPVRRKTGPLFFGLFAAAVVGVALLARRRKPT